MSFDVPLLSIGGVVSNVPKDIATYLTQFAPLLEDRISRQLCRQDYGMMEFDVMDLNGHRLVFAQPSPAE